MLYESFPAETRLTVYRGAPVVELETRGVNVCFFILFIKNNANSDTEDFMNSGEIS